MPYTIDYKKEGYIHLKIISPDSLEQHLAAVAQIQRLVKAHNCRRVLVDLFEMNDQTTLDKQDQFNFTQEWDHEAVEGCVFSIVLPEKKEFRDDWYFVTHIIKDSGTLGQPFSEREKAIEWLMSD